MGRPSLPGRIGVFEREDPLFLTRNSASASQAGCTR